MIRTTNANINAKVYDAPGAVSIDTIQPVTHVTEYETGSDKVTHAMHIVTGVAATMIFAGAGCVLAGSSLLLKDWSYYYNTIGILFLIGFSAWTLGSLFSFIGSFRSNNNTADRYIWTNIFSSIMFFLAGVTLILGAAFWLTSNDDLRYTGRILWIVGGGLTLGSFFIRILGVFWDATDLYRHETYIPSNEKIPLRAREGVVIDFKPTESHKAAIWGNAIASSIYLVSATTFWIGTVCMFLMWPYLEKNGIEYLTGCLWIAAGGMMLFGAIAHVVGRK
jgi:hypothetical protein